MSLGAFMTSAMKLAGILFTIAVAAKAVSFSNYRRKQSTDQSSDSGSKLLSVMKDYKFSTSHEWVKADGSFATMGITDHAQDHLGEIMYVQMPDVGTTMTKGESFGAVESMMAASDVCSPVSGEVVEFNSELFDSPELVKADPYGKGWIVKIKMSDAGELDSLMDADQYSKFCKDEDAKLIQLENLQLKK